MTSFDQMAAADPVGAAACRDAGRFDGHSAAALERERWPSPLAAPAEDRLYTGTAPHTVQVWESDVLLGPLEHRVVRHSPDGFSWGYGGSGPAELALNLIVDALGAEAWCPTCRGAGELHEEDRLLGSQYRGVCDDCRGDRLGPLAQPAVYQAFKAEVVAAWPETWTIRRSEVLAWVRAHRNSAQGAQPSPAAPEPAAWKGIARESVEEWIALVLDDGHGAPSDEQGAAAAIIDALGLRCVGWHAWTGDPETSVPLFVLDRWPLGATT